MHSFLLVFYSNSIISIGLNNFSAGSYDPLRLNFYLILHGTSKASRGRNSLYFPVLDTTSTNEQGATLPQGVNISRSCSKLISCNRKQVGPNAYKTILSRTWCDAEEKWFYLNSNLDILQYRKKSLYQLHYLITRTWLLCCIYVFFYLTGLCWKLY